MSEEMQKELEAMAAKLSRSVSAKLDKAKGEYDPKAAKEAFIQMRAKVHPNGGVVVVSRLPYGFFEDQLKGFFSQFGVVRKLRLSRNPKTGKSRHFAFMEFDNKEVAAIVADTMDGYMMFGRTLKCKYIPPEHVHPDTFRNHYRPFKMIPWKRINRIKQNKERTEEEVAALQSRLKRNEKKRRNRLAELGYDYDFSGFEGKKVETAVEQPKKKAKKAAVEEVAPVKAAKGKAAAKAVEEPVVEEPVKATKGKKATKTVEEPVVEEPVKATKGKKATKAVEEPVVEAPVKATKGKKAAAKVEEEVVEPAPKKATKKATKVVEEVVEEAPVKATKKTKKAAEAMVDEDEAPAPKKKKVAKK